MRPQVGQVINNKYRLVRIIGDGGMGSVYEARHEVLGTTVALKFLHPELSRRAGLVQRFLQEARVSAAIQSPHVVRVSDVDQMQSGQAFIVMEYLEGKTLQTLYEELYNAGQRLSYNDALEYACQMIDGVEAAHRSGVVHRDLKPDNVMLTIGSRGEPLLKLLDFGIAKLKVTGELDRGLTRPGVIMGTPEYMAPEQAYSADTVDVRADIFSLGVIIFEMLAGRRPVGGDDPHQIASSYLAGQVAQLSDLAPHVPPDLAKVIHRAMGAKPADRYDTLADFRAAFQPFAAAAHAPSAGPATTTPAPSSVVANNNFTTVPPTGQVGSIPKTLPPNDEDPPPGVVGPVVTPPQATPPSQIATPFGGFAANTPAGSGTSIGAPLQQMSQDGTTPAPPLPAAFDSNQRAGGTAIGSSLSGNNGGYNTPQGGYGQQPVHAQAQGWQPQGGYPQAPGYGQTPGYVPTQGQPTKTQRSGGAGIIVMLLIALIVTGVVMGGVYLSQKLNHSDENGNATATVPMPPPTTVPSESPVANPTQTSGPLTVPTMYTPPPPQQTHTPTGTSKPPPTGTSTSPQPSASTTATSIPTFPFPIPSGFPTSIPIPTFFPTSAPTTTSRPPTTTTAPPSTAPTTTTRPRIIIPIPRRSP
jgi:serine/threonine-protein kinase